MKTFANFAVSGQFAEVLTEKIFIEYGGIIINGHVIVVSHNSRSFNRENLTFSNLQKFSPAKDFRYTVPLIPVKPGGAQESPNIKFDILEQLKGLEQIKLTQTTCTSK